MTLKLGAGEQVLFEGHPSWRSILGFYLKGFAITAALAAVIALGTDLFGDGTKEGLVVLVSVAGVALTILVGFIKRVATRYTITNRRLHIKQGIVSRVVQESRLERVQDVTYSQSIFQRMMKIGDVDFDTAAAVQGDDELKFNGVEDPAAVVDMVHRATAAADSGLGDPPA